MNSQEDIKFKEQSAQIKSKEQGNQIDSNIDFNNSNSFQRPTNTENALPHGDQFSSKDVLKPTYSDRSMNEEQNMNHEIEESGMNHVKQGDEIEAVELNVLRKDQAISNSFQQSYVDVLRKDEWSKPTDHHDFAFSKEKSDVSQAEVLTNQLNDKSNDIQNPETGPPDFWVTFDDSASSMRAFPKLERKDSDPFRDIHDEIHDGSWEGVDVFDSIGMGTASSFFEPTFTVNQSNGVLHASNDVISPTFEVHSELDFKSDDIGSLTTTKVNNSTTEINTAFDFLDPSLSLKKTDDSNISNNVTSPMSSVHSTPVIDIHSFDFNSKNEGRGQTAVMNTTSSFVEPVPPAKHKDGFIHASNNVNLPTFEVHPASDFNTNSLDFKIMEEGDNKITTIMHQSAPGKSHDKTSAAQSSIFDDPSVLPTLAIAEPSAEFSSRNPDNKILDESFARLSNADDSKSTSFSNQEMYELPQEKHDINEQPVRGIADSEIDKQVRVSTSDIEADIFRKEINPKENIMAEVPGIEKRITSLKDEVPSMHDSDLNSDILKVSSLGLVHSNINLDARSKNEVQIATFSSNVSNEIPQAQCEKLDDNQESNQINLSAASKSNAKDLHGESNGFKMASNDEQDTKLFDEENKNKDPKLYSLDAIVEEGGSSNTVDAVATKTILKATTPDEVEHKVGSTGSSLSSVKDNHSHAPVGVTGSEVGTSTSDFQSCINNGPPKDRHNLSESGSLPNVLHTTEVASVSSPMDSCNDNGRVINFSEDIWSTGGDGLKYPEPALWEQLLEEELTVKEESTNHENLANTTFSSNPFTIVDSKDASDMPSVQQGHSSTPEQFINTSQDTTKGPNSSSVDAPQNADPGHSTGPSEAYAKVPEPQNVDERAETSLKERTKSFLDHQISSTSTTLTDANPRPSTPSRNPFDEDYVEGPQDENFETREFPLGTKDPLNLSGGGDGISLSEIHNQPSSWKPIISLNRTSAPAKQVMDNVLNTPEKAPSPKAEKPKSSIKSLWNMCTCCSGPAT